MRAKRRFPKWVILSLLLAFFAPEIQIGEAPREYDPAGGLLFDWLKDVFTDPEHDWASGLFFAGVFLIYFGIIYGLVRLVVSSVNQTRSGAVPKSGEGQPNHPSEPTSTAVTPPEGKDSHHP